MKTNYYSSQYGITPQQLKSFFKDTKYSEIELFDVDLTPKGKGRFEINTIFLLDQKEVKTQTSTTNTQLIDAWRSGQKEMYEDGEDGFESWDDVVETLLLTINLEL